MARQKNFILTYSVELFKLYRMALESWESVGACTTFYARYYFYARADSMQKRGYRGAHGRLRVIKLERIDSGRVALPV